jgi:hypothetical protein
MFTANASKSSITIALAQGGDRRAVMDIALTRNLERSAIRLLTRARGRAAELPVSSGARVEMAVRSLDQHFATISRSFALSRPALQSSLVDQSRGALFPTRTAVALTPAPRD